jgi:hypothetical protein
VAAGRIFANWLFAAAAEAEIRLNRLVPQTQSCEDMRWHVERMRRFRSDFRVAPRGRQRENRKLGRIVAVDQVVNDARMVRLLRQDTVQDLGRLLLAGIGLVGRRRSCDQRERVEDGGFAVFRITGRESLRGITPGERAVAMGRFIVILIEHFDNGDVIAFTLRFSSNRVGVFDRAAPFCQIGHRGRRPQGMVKTHSDSPVRHRASRIDTDYMGECLFRFVVPERVEKGDAAPELPCASGVHDTGKFTSPRS